MDTRLKQVQYSPGLFDGFFARPDSTTPFGDPAIEDL
jgi:hypothetical protein